MEPYSTVHASSGSSPEFSQKRTSSPGAPAPHAKRAKMEPGQGYSKKDKRRRRKKKQPIACNSGTMSGLVQDVRSSSLSPEPPLPSASCSTMDHSPPNVVTSFSKAGHIPIRNEHVVGGSHTESKSLCDHKALLASLVPSLMCQICLDWLHKPFSLSPCGHVSCYGCLVNWFNVDQQPDGREGERIHRKKTCPQCRAIVHGRPIEAWNVKDMVAAVIKSGLAQDYSQPVEVNSPEATSNNSEAPSRDPWASIFPPVPSHPETPPVGGSLSAFGMYDVEDQVHRCLNCMHEIWGGSCSQCGRHYSGHDIDAPDDEASGEEYPGIWGILPAMGHIMGFPHGGNVDESDDGSYESSFIDDEGSERHISEAVGISSDDNDDSIIEVTALATMDRVGNVPIAPSEDGQDGDENGNDIDGLDELQTVPRRPTPGRRRQVLSDSDVDSNGGGSANSDDHGFLSQQSMRLFGRLQGRHLLTHEDEDEAVDSCSTESDDNDRAFG